MIAQNRLKWLDGQIAGKDYLCGKRFNAGRTSFSMAGSISAIRSASRSIRTTPTIAAWFARIGERPPAKA
jgi:glutathione S-transferase